MTTGGISTILNILIGQYKRWHSAMPHCDHRLVKCCDVISLQEVGTKPRGGIFPLSGPEELAERSVRNATRERQRTCYLCLWLGREKNNLLQRATMYKVNQTTSLNIRVRFGGRWQGLGSKRPLNNIIDHMQIWIDKSTFPNFTNQLSSGI